MNAREGMRRLGILLGVSGGILGGFLGCSDAQDLWSHWNAHRQFESLMALPVTQKVASAAKIHQSGPWTQYAESTQVSYNVQRGEIEHPPDKQVRWVPVDDKIPNFDQWKTSGDTSKAENEGPDTLPREFFETK